MLVTRYLSNILDILFFAINHRCFSFSVNLIADARCPAPYVNDPWPETRYENISYHAAADFRTKTWRANYKENGKWHNEKAAGYQQQKPQIGGVYTLVLGENKPGIISVNFILLRLTFSTFVFMAKTFLLDFWPVSGLFQRY